MTSEIYTDIILELFDRNNTDNWVPVNNVVHNYNHATYKFSPNLDPNYYYFVFYLYFGEMKVKLVIII